MHAQRLIPILNVSDLEASFGWFERLGWQRAWAWDANFGAVCSGDCEIFLAVNGQGGRGKGPASATFGPNGDPRGDKGVWMSIWVDQVDPIYQLCLNHGVEVTFPPHDMPWSTRELHVRHPDGHVFRISQSLAE